MRKSSGIAIFLFVVLLGVGIFLYFRIEIEQVSETASTENNPAVPLSEPPPVAQIPVVKPVPVPEPTIQSVLPIKTTETNIVPFTAQAPGAKWSNHIFQDGCEEASMLMAIDWVHGIKTISATEATDGITALADFEIKRFGYYQDIDLSEIVSVFHDRFAYDGVMIRNDITIDGLKRVLTDGNIVLAPTFGQALRNPNFTAPGPITHMLVLTGYDPSTREFIVNDPGTKRGKGYQYDEKILYDAIWAYPPGTTHPPIPTPAERAKSVIVISPSRE
ncbi:MAG: C39 family peptidase [Candidatus Moraniibacteriota bacterium]